MTNSSFIANFAAIVAVAVSVAMAPLVAYAAPQPTPGAAKRSIPTDLGAGRYIITFAGEAAATYTGGTRNLAPTMPRAGGKYDAQSAAAKAYEKHLADTHTEVLRKVGVTEFTDYTVVLNGVAANLTAEQAKRLASDPTVVTMSHDRRHTVSTDKTPDFLAMPQVWERMGGRDKAGSGIVVGMIDTGITPENPSFAPNGTPTPPHFRGICQEGQEFTKAHCNGKIIGARYFLDGIGKDREPKDFVSPRDYQGHGSHTGSIAAGNIVDDVTVDNHNFGRISGMAPGAKIAVYKACWIAREGIPEAGRGVCTTSDRVAGLDAATRDGVDVVNVSSGDDEDQGLTRPEVQAFRNMAAAGVFAAASADNSGPKEASQGQSSPWVATVAASSHRIQERVLETGDGRRFVGGSITSALPNATAMVWSEDAVAAGQKAEDAKLCMSNSLDPAKVKGKLVLCVRGVNPRTDKSDEVKRGGGVGMVLVNPTEGSVESDPHAVPTVHLPHTQFGTLSEYARKPGATGRIVDVKPGESTTKVPEIAPFSGRGPSVSTRGNILKPDITAPGQNVLAAVQGDKIGETKFALHSGTSMSAPHIAGVGALLKAAHPTWSPMAIKSAMMTTARSMATPTSPFAEGAGNVQPPKAMDPGIVFDSNNRDWIGFLKSEKIIGAGEHPDIPEVTGPNLNAASIAHGSLSGTQTITRTLTSVSNATETYRFAAAVPGITMTADTPELTLKPGESRTVTITIRNDTVKPDTWAIGHATFTSGRHTARLPVTIRPAATTPNR